MTPSQPVRFPRIFCALAVALSVFTAVAYAAPPNVIVIITDDQGYGDIAAHGNTVITTPHLDKLHSQSVRLTDYHVDPTCSPTRSALMTGRYSTRTGVWHTINGRSMMHTGEQTVAEVFKANGYKTAMFGKWHLGDNAPCRPQDQGFEHVVWHKGGGVTQGPDYWENDYFDDTYYVGETPTKFEGYCTDVWFREATKFIEAKAKAKQPFFVYLSTNAPHGPFLVADKYSDPYEKKGLKGDVAKFLGMITNIDENVGALREKLDKLGLTDNTLLIFTTDNGTARGKDVYNAGMKAGKGSEYDGGHRVPFFMHWPNGNLTGGKDVGKLAAHIDILPTLVDLCELKQPAQPDGRAIDGATIKPALFANVDHTPKRTLFVHSQRIHMPEKWRKCAVMTERWRLVNGKELYDIETDPGQKNNIAAQHADVVAELRGAYDKWWASLEPVFDTFVRIDLGGAENPTTLMSHDWIMPKGHAPWHQRSIVSGQIANGPWMVNVVEAGMYEIKLYRWPPHLNKAMGCKDSRLEIPGHGGASTLNAHDTHASFKLKLKAGPTSLKSTLVREDGKEHGAYFVTVKRIDNE